MHASLNLFIIGSGNGLWPVWGQANKLQPTLTDNQLDSYKQIIMEFE